MNKRQIKKLNFLNLSPYVRYVHEVNTFMGFNVSTRVIYDHQIVFITKGTCDFIIEEQPFTLQSGDMVYMRPFVSHSMCVLSGGHFQCYSVHFDPVYLGEGLDFSPIDIYVKQEDKSGTEDRPVFELEEMFIPYVFHVFDFHMYMRNFQELLWMFQNQQFGHHIRMRAYLLNIIGLVVQELATNEGIHKDHTYSEKISEIIQYLYRHAHEQLDMNRLTEDCGVSPKYFRALFKKITGKSLGDYLTHIRMEHAKKLLRERKYTITEIAEKVGYPDVYYFSKLFKKVEGLSPKQYADTFYEKFM